MTYNSAEFYKIRPAVKSDLGLVQRVIEAAFSSEEGATISRLAAELSEENCNPPIKPFVVHIEDKIVGYVCYSPLFLKSDIGITAYILAPLAVSPALHRQAIGSSLVWAGVEYLNQAGVDVLLVYGDPDYYGRFGFDEEIGRAFVPPYPLEYPQGWQGLSLSEKAIPRKPIKVDCVQSLERPELW